VTQSSATDVMKCDVGRPHIDRTTLTKFRMSVPVPPPPALALALAPEPDPETPLAFFFSLWLFDSRFFGETDGAILVASHHETSPPLG
jgi:hypothetical protein